MGKIYIFDAKHILNEMISSVLRMQQEHFRLDNWFMILINPFTGHIKDSITS